MGFVQAFELLSAEEEQSCRIRYRGPEKQLGKHINTYMNAPMRVCLYSHSTALNGAYILRSKQLG